MWNNCKLCYQQLHLKYLCNLPRYWLPAAWGWHDSVETCSSVIICEIIIYLLVIVQNIKCIWDVLWGSVTSPTTFRFSWPAHVFQRIVSCFQFAFSSEDSAWPKATSFSLFLLLRVSHSGSVSDLYYKGAAFDSGVGFELLRGFLGFFILARQMLGKCLKWSHDCVLPHDFQFVQPLDAMDEVNLRVTL
jgi:hypothetical protein